MSTLPPIATATRTQLHDVLQHLRAVHLPRVRGSRRRTSTFDDDDAFERAHAIRWLTALIAHLHTDTDTTDADTDALTQHAAALLAACAGVAAAGTVHRQFTFPSPRVGEITVGLTDMPLDNHDYASVGAQTWGGACVLAEMIAAHPDRFGLGTGGVRVLELGAGTGLVGLTVAKVLQAWTRPGTVVLTDVYPCVLDNLQANIDANFPPSDKAVEIHSRCLDWSSFSATKPKPDLLSTPFDVILGADIVYEAQHAVWIRDCLASLLNHGSIFHLVIPLRPTHTFESRTIEDVFGAQNQPNLVILSKEAIVCSAYGYADDDVEYVYYRIGRSP